MNHQNGSNVNSKSELVRCYAPATNTTDRLSYYTNISFDICNNDKVTLSFKVDTGACYTIVGMKSKVLAPYMQQILSDSKPVYGSTITDATNTKISVCALEVHNFKLTDDIIIPRITICFSEDIGDKCVLGLDILSLFEFSYIHEKHQLIGTFWIHNYVKTLDHIISRFSASDNTYPRSIMEIDESVIDDNLAPLNSMTNLDLLHLVTNNVCRAKGVDPNDIDACIALAASMLRER